MFSLFARYIKFLKRSVAVYFAIPNNLWSYSSLKFTLFIIVLIFISYERNCDALCMIRQHYQFLQMLSAKGQIENWQNVGKIPKHHLWRNLTDVSIFKDCIWCIEDPKCPCVICIFCFLLIFIVLCNNTASKN